MGTIIRPLAYVPVVPTVEPLAASILCGKSLIDPPKASAGTQVAEAAIVLSGINSRVRITFNAQVQGNGLANRILALLVEDGVDACVHVHSAPSLSRSIPDDAVVSIGFVIEHQPWRQTVTYSVRIGADQGAAMLRSGFKDVPAGVLIIDEITEIHA